MSDDLSEQALTEALGGRAVRFYPAVVSTEADALQWARAGAPEGAVVVAAHQAAPRGRAGLVWRLTGAELVFSLVLRPHLAAEREGWPYVAAGLGVADVLGAEATVGWPDEVWKGESRAGALALHSTLGPRAVEWAVLTVMVVEPPGRRAAVLADVVAAVEARLAQPAAEVLDAYRARCRTLGRRVEARLVPLGPTGRRVVGRAAGVLKDGALVVETDDERRVLVRPQALGVLAAATDDGPSVAG